MAGCRPLPDEEPNTEAATTEVQPADCEDAVEEVLNIRGGAGTEEGFFLEEFLCEVFCFHCLLHQ